MLILQTDKPVVDSPSTLRGFIGQMFHGNSIIHHHLNNEPTKLVYSYPKIQYKIIGDLPIILGISEGVEVVEALCKNLHHLNLKSKTYKITNKIQEKMEIYFGIAKNDSQYKFLTPWLALDEESFCRYKKRNEEEKNRQLESILIGNIISMSKSLGYTVPKAIKVKIDKLKEVKTSLKGTPMLGFLGTFSVNFEIPDYWGIGKSVSRGFGTIKRVKELRCFEEQRTESRRQEAEDRAQTADNR